MKTSPIKRLQVLTILISLLPGPIALGAYSLAIKFQWLSPLAVYKNKLAIVSMWSSYAPTMLGLLAALIALLFSATSSSFFQQYRQRGYLKPFFTLYAIAIINLLVMSVFIIPNFGNVNTALLFNLTSSLFINSLVHISLISLIIINLLRQAI